MANFIAVVDAAEGRRRRFIDGVRELIAPVESLRTADMRAGDFAAVWATREDAPVSVSCSAAAATIIWGDAISSSRSRRIDAAELFTLWKPTTDGAPPAFDGFHAALRFEAGQGLVVGADLLGLFPLYYASHTDVVLVGTSPELFHHHPSFPARLDVEGLTGILLTHAPFNGGALLAGVRRLRPGHALVWRRGIAPTEHRQYALPQATPADGETFHSDVERLDEALARAIDRQRPVGSPSAMLLSGGRDSRLIAGYLRECTDRVHALTLGRATDYEMQCATAAARVLGWDHRMKDLDERDLPAAAEIQARWEHLGTGFSNVHMWTAIRPLRTLPSHFFAGYNLESRSGEPAPLPFEELARSKKNRGLHPSRLDRLLRHDVFDGLVQALEEERTRKYESASPIEVDRLAHFFMAHDWRAHAGGIPWKLSFGAWPVLPLLDRALLETLFTIPASSLVDRRAQDEILRRRFPDLARVPLDRNSVHPYPLLPSATDRVRHAILQVADPIARRMPRRIERRYYHRIYDINGPAWREVRRRAEPHRERLAPLFRMDALADLIPAPDARIPVRSTTTDSFQAKMLIGLMLWSAQHLP